MFFFCVSFMNYNINEFLNSKWFEANVFAFCFEKATPFLNVAHIGPVYTLPLVQIFVFMCKCLR